MPRLTNQASVKVLSPSGHVRMGEAVDALRAQVEQNIHGGHSRLVVDMGQVTTLDSSGIGVLVRGLTLSRQHGGALKLVGLPTQVMHTLKITGLLRLFEVYEDQQAAIASFGD